MNRPDRQVLSSLQRAQNHCVKVQMEAQMALSALRDLNGGPDDLDIRAAMNALTDALSSNNAAMETLSHDFGIEASRGRRRDAA